MPTPPLRIERLDAVLGARVDGLDLREPLEPGLLAALRDALFEHQVLFFRNQPLSDDEHIAFASQFGEPNVYPVVELAGGSQPLEFPEDGPNRPPVAAAWHTDVTWLQDPPKIGVLAARVMPEHGGDTLWCSLYSVYESLASPLREEIADVVIHHAPGEGFMKLVVGPLGEKFSARFHERYGDGARHALVRDHYVTGRPLVYLSGGFMDHVVGREDDEDRGRALIHQLIEIASDPAHHIRWEWQVDDIAIWDERSTMHRVDANHWPEPRKMRRCTIG